MFKKYGSWMLASLIGIGALALPATGAWSAMPAVQQNVGTAVSTDNFLRQDVHHWNNNNWYWNDNHHWRHHRHRDNFRFGLAFPLYFGGGYYNQPYYYGRSLSNAHIEWCLNRYRSYNIYNNTWVSYSGQVHQCHSPYQY